MALKAKYPIILAHGIYRFDILWNKAFDMDNQDNDDWHYFKNIRSLLMNAGFDEVWHGNVGFGGSADDRAAILKEQVLKWTKKYGKAHIIAHSMGGLDTRHMLYNYRDEDIDKKVASLSTIGTPHSGSSIADLHYMWAKYVIHPKQNARLDLSAIKDLTRHECKAFNDKTESWEAQNKVVYKTYAGAQSFMKIFGPLKGSFAYIKLREGANDGLVPVSSAKWKDEYFVEPVLVGDHLNEIGWWDPAELLSGDSYAKYLKKIKEFYLGIANSLVDMVDSGVID